MIVTKMKLVPFFRRLRSFISRPRLLVQHHPVIIDDDTLCCNPIFIAGIHRSGTSLVRRIFDSHSGIACPPETYYLKHFASMLNDPQTFAGLAGMGYDREAALREIGKLASRLHEAYRISKGKRRWADKTPQYLSMLDEIHLMFGGAERFILIQRHPYDIAYSIFKRGWSFGQYAKDPLENTALYVADMWHRMSAFEVAQPELCHRIVYEELIANPEAVLKGALAFLKEEWESGILEFNSFPHNWGVEDPIVQGIGSFSLSYGNWTALSAREITTIDSILSPLLKGTGYSSDPHCKYTSSALGISKQEVLFRQA